jgi:hypothetical protein
MKKLGLLAIILCYAIVLNGQNRNNVWCFGDSAGIDFNSGIPLSISSSLDSRGSSASISDTSGNLIFYSAYDPTVNIAGTDPVKVYSSNNAIMLNGDSIKGGGWYREIIITPDPANSNQFYLINIGVTLDYGIYYSKIDMTQNGGLGAVTQKNIQLQNFKVSDGLAAIKHGNGRDWWILFRNWTTVNSNFYQYLITPNGISNVIIQSIGSSTDNGFSKIIFSHDGSKMVLINYPGLMEIYDFNRCTGIISTPVTIHLEPVSPPFNNFWSAEFSPNGRFLYVTSYKDTCYLYQYDLQSPNPASTRITLDTITNYLIGIGNLKLAPDGKIYLTHAWECPAFPYCYPYPDSVYNQVNMNLSVINYPDSLGTDCGYAPFSFYLGGKRTYYGLPNNPDYDMASLAGSPCDSLTGIDDLNQIINSEAELNIYYSIEWQTAFINASKLQGRYYSLKIIDMTGKEILVETGDIHSTDYTKNVNCASFRKGVYLVSLTIEREMLVKRFVVP